MDEYHKCNKWQVIPDSYVGKKNIVFFEIRRKRHPVSFNVDINVDLASTYIEQKKLGGECFI